MATRKLKAVLTAEDRASSKLSRFGSVITTLGVTAATVGAVQIGRKLVGGIQKAVDAAGVQEAAEQKLAQSLRNTGQAVGTVLPQLRAQASALQDLTGVGDELILENQALLVSLGKLRGEGLERATKAALDLSAGLGLNQRTAFDLVAKAASGYTSTLSRYGIILDESLTESEKFEEALRIINEQFGGQAAAKLDTYQGRLAELQGRFGDLQEAIGGPFRDVLKEVFATVLSPTIKDLTDAGNEADFFRNSIITLGIAGAELGVVLADTGARLAQFLILLEAIPGSAVAGFKNSIGIVREFLAEYAGDADTISPLGRRFQELIERLEELRGQTERNADAGRGNAGAIQEQTDAAETFNEVLEVTTGRLLSQEEAVRRIAEVGAAAFTAQAKDAGDTILSLGGSIQQALRTQGVNAALKFGDALVSAAQGGKVSLGNLFRSLLADLARSIAQALILRAILSSVGGGGGGGGGGGFTGLLTTITGFGVRRGGIIGARSGYMVPGMNLNRDSQLIAAQPGEAVLPRELTRFLMSAAQGGRGSEVIELRLEPGIVAERLNDNVRRGNVRLLASELAGPAGVR